jgi:hypothetical protein
MGEFKISNGTVDESKAGVTLRREESEPLGMTSGCCGCRSKETTSDAKIGVFSSKMKTGWLA